MKSFSRFRTQKALLQAIAERDPFQAVADWKQYLAERTVAAENTVPKNWSDKPPQGECGIEGPSIPRSVYMGCMERRRFCPTCSRPDKYVRQPGTCSDPFHDDFLRKESEQKHGA